jgi:hypothetical protein
MKANKSHHSKKQFRDGGFGRLGGRGEGSENATSGGIWCLFSDPSPLVRYRHYARNGDEPPKFHRYDRNFLPSHHTMIV